jgi:uncharacterized membrane protein SpoIIM required for sporulation
MRQEPFEAARTADWELYRSLLSELEGGRKSAAAPAALAGFPELYRRLCGDYALARARRYSPGLIADLHDLVRRGYRQIYRRRVPLLGPALAFMASVFPRTLRRHASVFALSSALLFLPMAAMGLACYANPELVYSAMSAEQAAEMEAIYDPANRKPGRTAERQDDTDFMMFGYYVMNNVGIAFRTFASGLLVGLGSAALLVYNGVVIGAVAGHLSRLGFGSTFWPFASGHAPYELTAIAISGAAGLLLGQALLAPGRRTRLAALRENARAAVVLAGGAAGMLVLAAVVEAFWSGGTEVPNPIKYAVGALGWLLVALYLALAGRGADRDSGDGA